MNPREKDEESDVDRAKLMAEIEKIRGQRARARERARERYRPYGELSPGEKAKRLEYGRSYRQRQNAIMELGVELGVIEAPKRAKPVHRALDRVLNLQETQERPSRALALVPAKRRKA